MKLIKLLFLGLFFFTSCDDGNEVYHEPDEGDELVKVSYNKRAKEIFDLIKTYYKAGDLLKENNPTQNGDNTYSFLWPYDGFVSGSIQLSELGYDVDIEKIVDGYEKYLSLGAHGNSDIAYGSSTDGTGGGGTRFYDDNSIVGISLLEAYGLTKEERYKERASLVFNFLAKGVDNDLGGALWWNEDYKYDNQIEGANKPACSNGYATLFLLKYYLVCDENQKEEVLKTAKELYTWLRDNLYDVYTKCYWNDKSASGNINPVLWTYNSAVMIQNGIRLYEITGDEIYLEDANATAQGAYDYFVRYRNGVISYPDHDPWFNTKLLRAYIDLVPYNKKAESYVKTYISFIDRGYDVARTDLGFFYEDWTGNKQGRYYSLLMQVAVVESYGVIAKFKEEYVE